MTDKELADLMYLNAKYKLNLKLKYLDETGFVIPFSTSYIGYPENGYILTDYKSLVKAFKQLAIAKSADKKYQEIVKPKDN